MNRLVSSPPLPGAYCHDNSPSNTTSSALNAYHHETVGEPTPLNNMAIISPIFFSPTLSPGSLRTSLPGTWVDSSPFQLKQENSAHNDEKENSHTLANAHRHYHQRYHHNQSPVTPKDSTASTLSPPPSSPILDQVDMNQLRETIASLKERAKQLEQTDLVVKKSIEIVAKKRMLAQRRQHSQWDWCDQPNDTQGRISPGVPVLDDVEDDAETDHSDEEHDGCGGDWEWID